VIEPKQVRERASKLYYDIKRRSAPTYWKNGRMAGRMKWPGAPVPYSSETFATWLLTEIGCNAFLCPYCNAPLDVLSMTLDHSTPLAIGGDNEFSNLIPCCGDCNGLKHKLTGQEYLALRLALRTLPPNVEANVLARLRAGALGQRLLWEKQSKKKPALVTSEEPF
jgi:5-methylcytosine-specific restriction endonuclease McrA